MRTDINSERVQQYHGRLGYLSYKDVKLPKLPGDNPQSTTTVLDLIKQKKSEYYVPQPAEQMQSETIVTSPVEKFPRLRTSVEIYVQTEDPQSKEVQAFLRDEPPKQAVSLEKTTNNKIVKYKLRTHSRLKTSKVSTPHYQRLKTVQDQQPEEVEEEATERDMFRMKLASIPQLGRMRTVKNMAPFVEMLIQTNPFFKNTPTVLVNSLLKVCSIRTFAKNQQIYKKSEKLISFYIVLWGKVKVSDVLADYRKICGRGETLCQHILFAEEKSRLRLENAKAITEATLLEIPVYLYKKIYEELTLYGYKNDFLMMEALIRRNYIEKQSHRQK